MMITITLMGEDVVAGGNEALADLARACAAFAGVPPKTESEQQDTNPCIDTQPNAAAPAQTLHSHPPESAAPPAPPIVPTVSAPTYTLEELQVACAPLIDANRMGDLQSVIAKFGATSLLDIPKEQYGALAADLRALGARL